MDCRTCLSSLPLLSAFSQQRRGSWNSFSWIYNYKHFFVTRRNFKHVHPDKRMSSIPTKKRQSTFKFPFERDLLPRPKILSTWNLRQRFSICLWDGIVNSVPILNLRFSISTSLWDGLAWVLPWKAICKGANAAQGQITGRNQFSSKYQGIQFTISNIVTIKLALNGDVT